jgi:phage terminase large subunit-like protein
VGRRGIGSKPKQRAPKPRSAAPEAHPWQAPGLSRAERVIRFCESLPLTAGRFAGSRLQLRPWQRKFIKAVYADKGGNRLIRTAVLSVARKNGKTQLASALCLAHLCGPESEARGECYSVACTRFQAGRVFSEMTAIITRTAWLAERINIIRFRKELEDDITGSTFAVLAADVAPVHGLSPSFVCYDELAQVPTRALYDALGTAMGARTDPLMVVISTQAASDTAPMSELVDYGLRIQQGEISDPHFHLTLYTADESADPWKVSTWRQANPALNDFRSLEDVKRLAGQAKEVPSSEASFRQLVLNQRVEAFNPFITPALWRACNAEPVDLKGIPVYAGLDLSEVKDLTALVLIGKRDGIWSVHPTFWLPSEGLAEKARADRVHYDVWARQGHLRTTPGHSISYEWVAEYLRDVFNRYDIRKLGFDRWNMKHLRPWLIKAGFSEQTIDEKFVEVGMGTQTMSPALRDLEQAILERQLAHGGQPVLAMCAANAVVESKDSSNRKLSKNKSSGRIDGMVALACAFSVAPLQEKRIDASTLVTIL